MSIPLWTLAFECPMRLAEDLAGYLEEMAVSVTMMVPPRHESATIEAIFQEKPDLAALASELSIRAKLLGGAISALKLQEVGDLDWLKKVATDFPPLPIARWTVYGAAHKAAVKGKHLALQIDATSAFGTGEHPTTRGCLLLLSDYLKRARPRKMLDVGCGSGILSMAQAKICHGCAVAVDLDPESVRIARQNVRANGLGLYVKTGKSRGYNAPLVHRHAPYDLIMANIFAGPLCQIAKDLKAHLAPNGYVILSGILNHQANRVVAAHRAQGLGLVKRIRLGEWSVLALQDRQS